MASLASSLQIDPVTGQPIDPRTGQPMAPAANAQSIYGDPSSQNNIPNTIGDPNAPMQNRYTQNQNIIGATGTELNNEAINSLNYYGSLVPQYQQRIDAQLQNLEGTPGYTPGESSQINTDYSQFNTTPGEYSDIAGNPNAAKDVAFSGASGEGAMLNQYQQNLGGEVGNYATGVEGATGEYGKDLGGAVDAYGNKVGGAVDQLKGGLSAAQNFDMLNKAVGSKGLDFDPNGTEQQLTNADVQNMKTAAGTRIGNQYKSAEDTLERQAQEAGNSSPFALAAARSRLMSQEAADQGDAELNADIAAKQAQFQRAQGIEQQRIGSEQTKSGMQATAGTTEEAAAQAAAGLAGTAGIAANENIAGAGLSAAENLGAARIQSAKDVGQQDINAANQYGQFSTNTQSDIANKETAATQAADAAAAARATTAANMRYGQGTGSAQATSQGAQTVGNARIAGEGALRSGLAGQEQVGQTGANQSMTQQNQTYGTQTGGLNSSAASQGQFINGKPSLGDSLAGGFAKGITGLIGAPAGAAKGDIITEPQTRVIAEKGPEMVLTLPHMQNRYRRAA